LIRSIFLQDILVSEIPEYNLGTLHQRRGKGSGNGCDFGHRYKEKGLSVRVPLIDKRFWKSQGALRGEDKPEKKREVGRGLLNHTASQMGSPFVRHLVIFFSTGLYSGYSPVAPGTAGTLVAIPLYLVLSRLPAPSYGITAVAFLFMACWFSGAAESIFLKKDSGRIVIDEIGGFLVTMGFLPPVPLYIFSGFILFRFFDIVKPFPIKRLQALRGGYGVVADDVVAGIYGNLVLHVCLLFV